MHSNVVMTSFNITFYSTRINEGGRGLWWLMECDHDANGEKKLHNVYRWQWKHKKKKFVGNDGKIERR